MDADEFDGLDGLYADPNGPAYQRMETLAGRTTADSSRAPDAIANELVYGTEAAFHQACVSYLALQNMLAHAIPPEFAERLLAMDRDEFDGWLADITRGGSVT